MKFTADQFKPTEWSTAKDKADFANHFVKFVLADFPSKLFDKKFYDRLSSCFGHIAHYNQDTFYDTFFSDTRRKLEFVNQTLTGGGHGDPLFTFSDVERELHAWLRENNIKWQYEMKRAAEVETAERALLKRLKEKYE